MNFHLDGIHVDYVSASMRVHGFGCGGKATTGYLNCCEGPNFMDSCLEMKL